MFAQLRNGLLVFAAWHADRLARVAGLALRAGAYERAALAAATAAELALRSPGVPLLAGLAAHARGLLDRNVDSLRQAVDLLAASEWPLATAAAREDFGNVLAGQGAREQAIGELEAADQAYLDMGAHRDTARVRGALRNLGIRKRRIAVARPAHGWGSLTSAELAVAGWLGIPAGIVIAALIIVRRKGMALRARRQQARASSPAMSGQQAGSEP